MLLSSTGIKKSTNKHYLDPKRKPWWPWKNVTFIFPNNTQPVPNTKKKKNGYESERPKHLTV